MVPRTWAHRPGFARFMPTGSTWAWPPASGAWPRTRPAPTATNEHPDGSDTAARFPLLRLSVLIAIMEL